jgi:hypothetical protein
MVIKRCVVALCILPLAWTTTGASEPPDFSGAWTVLRGAEETGRFGVPRETPRLTAAGESARANYLSVTEGTNHGPGNSCVGYGMPGSALRSGGYPMEIIQRPEQLFVIYEAHNEIRRIYIGTEADDPETFFRERNGYSSAYWEGHRLIVETTRLKTQIDSAYPHTDEATIREVYYLGDPLEDGTRVLVNELTMTDPAWLEEPFTVTKRWQELAGYHVLTYECTEPNWLDELEMLYDAAGLEMVQQ